MLKLSKGVEETGQEGWKASRVSTVAYSMAGATRDVSPGTLSETLWDMCQNCLMEGEKAEALLLKLHPLLRRI